MKLINRVANRIESTVVAKFRINKKSINGEKILNIEDSQELISDLIERKSPFLVA